MELVDVMTCTICRHTGEDVGNHLQHVGGVGEVLITQCDNQVECWQRLDNQVKEEYDD